MAKAKEVIDRLHVLALAQAVAKSKVYNSDRMKRVTCNGLTGRKRSRAWNALVDQGYIVADRDNLAGEATDKAWDEAAPDHDRCPPVNLAAKFRWEAWHNRDGAGVWVVWDNLTPAEQVSVAARHRADPEAVEFLAVTEMDEKWERFRPENGDTPANAYVRLGKKDYWHGKVAVRDAVLVAKAGAAAKAHYRQQVVAQGLNEYLYGTGVLAKGSEAVTVQSDQPSFSGRPHLPRDPSGWTQDVFDHYLDRYNARFVQARLDLEAAQKLLKAVEAAGGPDAFRAAYLKAVNEHVEEKWAEHLAGKE